MTASKIIQSRIKKVTKSKQTKKNSEQKFVSQKCFIFNSSLDQMPNFLQNTCSFNTICFKSLDMSLDINPYSALLLAFGADFQIIQPLLQKGIKTLLVINQKFKQNDQNVVSYTHYKNFKKIERQSYQNFNNQFKNNQQVQLNSTFHPKLYLLKFEGFLWVVIGTGNLFNEDWKHWNNIFYIQDFPIKSINFKNNQIHEDFLQDFDFYLHKTLNQEYDYLVNDLQINIHQYDYNDVQISIVYSLPGFYQDIKKVQKNLINKNISKARSGLSHLENQMTKYQYSNIKYLREQKIELFFITSSLGASNIRFIHQFVESIFPFKKAESLEQLYSNKEQYSSMLHLIYPTTQFVHSTQNPSKFKPYFLLQEYFDEFRFEKSILSKYQLKDKDSDNDRLSHVKMFVSLINNQITDDSTIYIGSHNFTKQAWGKSYDKQEYYQVNNNEIGVLFGPKKDSQKTKENIVKNLRFKIPSDKYEEYDQPYMNSQ